MSEDMEVLADSVLEALGPSDEWIAPGGYPGSLALCVIDSIQSIGQRYAGVRRVVARYCEHRGTSEVDNRDGVGELAESFQSLGGIDRWVTEIGTRNRVYASREAPLKAAVISQAADLLIRHDVLSSAALRETSGERREDLKRQWIYQLPSQRSGITWRYLHMLAGDEGVKPDRMIQRFLASISPVLGALKPDEAADVVTRLATQLGVRPNVLDHRIWNYQRSR